MARERHAYLVFDIDGWLLYHEESDKIPTVAELARKTTSIWANELARDLQIRRISIRNTDIGPDRTRIITDNTNRRDHQGRKSMSRLVGGEITEVSFAAWRAEIEPRYPAKFADLGVGP